MSSEVTVSEHRGMPIKRLLATAICALSLGACTPPGYYAATPDKKPATPQAAQVAAADPKAAPCDPTCQWNAARAWAAAVEQQQVDAYLHAIADARWQRQIDPRLVCIRKGESGNGGGDPWPYIRGYQAKNPSSSASGAYQMLDNTARNLANAAGHGEVAGIAARWWPWYVQDEVALWALNHPQFAGQPWRGTALC